MQVFIFAERRFHKTGPLYVDIVFANSKKKAWSMLTQSLKNRCKDITDAEVRASHRLLKQQNKPGVVLTYNGATVEIPGLDKQTTLSIIDN